jgi:hypothetical protein
MSSRRCRLGALALLAGLCFASPGRSDEQVARGEAGARTVVLPWLLPVKGLTTSQVERLFKEEIAAFQGGCGNLGPGDFLDAIFMRSKTVVRFRIEAQGLRAVGAWKMTAADERALRR